MPRNKPIGKNAEKNASTSKPRPRRSTVSRAERNEPNLNTRVNFSLVMPSAESETRGRGKKRARRSSTPSLSSSPSRSRTRRQPKRRKSEASVLTAKKQATLGERPNPKEKSKLSNKMVRKERVKPKPPTRRVKSAKAKSTLSSEIGKTKKKKSFLELDPVEELPPRSSTRRKHAENQTGQERGVPWIWTANPSLKIEAEGGEEFNVPAHPLHDNASFGVGGNLFYGGLTALTDKGKVHHSKTKTFHPKEDSHTEDQYFQNFDELRRDVEKKAKKETITHLVMEMNQKNTPCSKGTCRPQIIDRVKASDKPKIHARLGADQLYSHQPPKVGITYGKGKEMLKSGTDSAVLKEPSVVHMVPREMG